MNEVQTLISRLPLSQLGCNILISCEGLDIYINGHEGHMSETPLDQLDATIRLSKDHLLGILKGEENAISLFTTGAIEVDGDMSVAFKLKQIFG